jgi:hypothetical protein
MALRHKRLTDLSDPRDVQELNNTLRDIVTLVNQGGEIRKEVPRSGDDSPLYGTPSEGSQKEGSLRLRAVPLVGGQKHKLQFFDGQEWKDV